MIFKLSRCFNLNSRNLLAEGSSLLVDRVEYAQCRGLALGVVLCLHGAYVRLTGRVLLVDDGNVESLDGGVFRNLDDPIVAHSSRLGIEEVW